MNIEVLCSNHANQLVVVVDDAKKARTVSIAWMREMFGPVTVGGAAAQL